jgi:hypothetical protein
MSFMEFNPEKKVFHKADLDTAHNLTLKYIHAVVYRVNETAAIFLPAADSAHLARNLE